VDEVGRILKARVEALIAQRPDFNEDHFYRTIKVPSPSWKSEFKAGKRTSNKLRQVIAIARYFKVPVGYLLNELPDQPDAATLTLLAAWKDLKSQRDRDAVLRLALILSREEP
jgi:hypothetical protein